MWDCQMSVSGNRTIRLFHLTMTSVPKNICKVKGFIFVMQMLTKLKKSTDLTKVCQIWSKFTKKKWRWLWLYTQLHEIAEFSLAASSSTNVPPSRGLLSWGFFASKASPFWCRAQLPPAPQSLIVLFVLLIELDEDDNVKKRSDTRCGCCSLHRF